MSIGNYFAETVNSGALLIAAPLAMIAGIVSFLSPCILPLVPGYLGYVSGLANPTHPDNRRRVLTGVGLFILGFAAVFTLYGAAFGLIGGWLLRWQDLLIRILGVLVILMGLALMGMLTFLQRTTTPSFTPRTGLAGAPLLGLGFGQIPSIRRFGHVAQDATACVFIKPPEIGDIDECPEARSACPAPFIHIMVSVIGILSLIHI